MIELHTPPAIGNAEYGREESYQIEIYLPQAEMPDLYRSLWAGPPPTTVSV